MLEPKVKSEGLSVRADELLGLSPELINSVRDSLLEKNQTRTRMIVASLRASEFADLLQLLSPNFRRRLIECIGSDFDPQVLAELEGDIQEEISELLGPLSLANMIIRLDIDDALELIITLRKDRQWEILKQLPSELRNLVEEGLAFPKDSAGRLMGREFVAVPSFWTVEDTIKFLRAADNLPNEFYEVFIVNPHHRPIGKVSLSNILRNEKPTKISSIMLSEIVTVPAIMDQEEVAFVFSQKDLVSVPVVDQSLRLIGVITVDDVLDVIQEEAEEDIMRLGGVKSDDLYSAALQTGRSRFSWLFLNLITAIVVSIVIGIFEATLEQIVMLAVLMPIVASMGGNAGTQTMTVAVRALATKELSDTNAMRVMGKEFLVGIYNGILFASLVGGVAWFWTNSLKIGGVMAGAMMITLIMAALSGMIIPLFLQRAGIDPAIASGVVLTTITDIIAFGVFLGFATLLLL
ncbi:MAG: magnesium transporter [Rhodospirillaceae bacterium]|nr:magnesium transporter [Rhodospirillaceae bacterium]